MGPKETAASPALGQAIGSYRQRAPLSSLQHHFSCTWFHRFPTPTAPPAAIVPDGSIDLQWINGALRIAGPDRTANIEEIPAGAIVIGLRFQPAAAQAWLRVSVSEIVGARLPLEIFWGSEAGRLADWAGDGRSPEGIAARLETALARKAIAVAPPDDAAQAIFRLIDADPARHAFPLHCLGAVLGLSERTLRRRCHEAFGYGPKTLDRILRFQRFLRLARTADPAGAASLAADAGYADQSHLTRETRRLAGLTPMTIVQQIPG